MTLEQIGILTGIFSAIAAGIYFIFKEYKTEKLRIRVKFAGQWGNEGDVTWSKNETHFVELSLTVDQDDGEITGIIISRSVKSDDTLPTLSVNGKLHFKSANIKFTHVRHGEILVYGNAKITLKGKLLHWTLRDGFDDGFPEKTKLHRQFIAVAG